MKSSFSLYRFQKLLKLHFTENGKSYLIALGLSIGGLLLQMSPILVTQSFHDPLYVIHVSALLAVLLAGSLFTSTAFHAYCTSSSGIPALMLPASRLEKFLVILLSNLLFVVLIFLIFYLLHHGLVALANQQIAEGQRKYQLISPDIFRFFTYTYFLVHGAVFLGSLYFLKNAYIKSLGILLLVVIIAFLFNSFLAYQFTGYYRNILIFPFTSWTIFLGETHRIHFPEVIAVLIKIFLTLLIVALWHITYVRLKEKEI